MGMDIDWTWFVNVLQLICLLFIMEAVIKINRRQAENEFERGRKR